MTMFCRLAAVFVAVLQLAACGASSSSSSSSPRVEGTAATVLVVSRSWHSSVVLARADLPAGVIPESADFPQSRFLEFGWGDEEYYQAAAPTIMMTLRAALWPTPSVLLVEAFDARPAARYPDADIVELRIEAKDYAALIDFIDRSFDRGNRGRDPGPTTGRRFYPANGDFHLLQTCNTWVAKALRAGGLDIDVGRAKLARSLMVQVRSAVAAR